MNRDTMLPLHMEPVRLSAEPGFALGDLAIHPSAREAIRDGRPQTLEPRVMQVLVALARAGGAVVSRDALIQCCWDGRVVGEASINRCIFKLRELADRGDGGHSFRIDTIARVGYRLQTAAVSVTNGAASAAPRAGGGRRIVAAAAMGLAILGLVAALSVDRGRDSHTPPAVPATVAPSIAVLPFKDLSADADAAYFAAAIQDEILTRLAKIGSLKVISRTSSVEVAKKPGSLAEIARTLGVANILEGSVQRSGDMVRVNVQLIRAATDDHLWAEDYDRRFDDVLSVENDIASSIATALAAKITPGESLALSAKPTTNAKAYDAYLRALVLYRKYDDAAWRDAQKAFEQAVAIDPDFGLAWAMLARMHASFYFWERDPARRDSARHALDRALALAPDLAEVQLARAYYKHYVELDYEGAERELRALHARWPNDLEVLQSLALVARRLGHWQESIAYLRQARTLDPLSRSNSGYLAETLGFAHRPAEAAEVTTGIRAIWPDDTDIIVCEAGMLLGLGELDRADAELKLLPTSVDANGDTLVQRRAQYAFRRRFAEGLSWFEALRASAPVQDWDPLRRATLDLALGDFRRWSGDVAGARQNYQAAADALRENANATPANSDALTLSALAYSGLGDRQSALRYADRLARQPLSADAVNGAVGRENRAIMLARLDDRDAAIAALTRVVKEPSQMTPQRLRLEPDFDTLRADPRFEQLMAANAQPIE
jgi:TolB-like protein/DNA-binding winged helix-turn-helix (wHTH) protein/Flp pilus assembly protein TadD